MLMSGCVTTSPVSKTWYKQLLKDIGTAYENYEITQADYNSLKNQADQIRATKKVACR
jgi:hypothetical protein